MSAFREDETGAAIGILYCGYPGGDSGKNKNKNRIRP
jgi:hypothetical protein